MMKHYCSSRRASGTEATNSKISRTSLLPSGLKGTGISTMCVQFRRGKAANDVVNGSQEATCEPSGNT